MAVRHLFTVEEWHHMGETGLFGEDARVELLDGEVIEMAPIGSPHAGGVNRLTRLFTAVVGDQALVAVQNPVLLDRHSEPQPDIAVLKPRPDSYADSHPTPAEILLLVEVSDSTLAFDRERKAATYARAGVPEYWIVDLTGDRVLVMRSPVVAAYRNVSQAGRGERLGMQALPGIEVDMDEVLGPAG
jgi:Uma2 family endonuclease